MEFFILPFQSDFLLNEVLLVITSLILLFTCYKLTVSKNLLDSVVVMSIFSLMIGVCYLLMDAPDVTMTEVALGSALSTCVMLNILSYTGGEYKQGSKLKKISSLMLCIILVLLLSVICFDLPLFGASDSPLQINSTKYYVENIYQDIQIPSIVAAILGSYRGFDTLGETTVILIAGLGVLMLTSRKKDIC